MNSSRVVLIVLLSAILGGLLSIIIDGIENLMLFLFIAITFLLIFIRNEKIVFFVMVSSLMISKKYSFYKLNTSDLVSPIVPEIRFGFIDVFIIVLFFYNFSSKRSEKNKYVNSKKGKSGFIFFSILYILLFILGTLTSIDILFSIAGLINIIKIVVFFVLIVRVFKPMKHFNSIFWAMVTNSIILFVLSIGFSVFKINKLAMIFMGNNYDSFATRGDTYRAVGTFNHPGELGVYLGIVILFFVSTILVGAKKRIGFIILMINIISLFLTGSRGAMISTTIAILFIYIVYKRLRLKTIIQLIATIFLLFILVYTLASNLFFSENSKDMVEDRLQFIDLSKEVIKERTFFWGVGPNAYTSSSINIKETGTIPTWAIHDFLRTPAHNIYILQLAELGLFGVLSWFCIFISILVVSIKQLKNIEEKWLKIIVLVSIGCILHYLIYGLTGWTPLQEHFLWNIAFFIGLSYKVLFYRSISK
ncbi:O-antigen ligase family protein [Niallia sp.]|uniref:O-antigen ligase family protein n=1 Tax=Niallia sp. TaxID=2837523 RepID=UPI00289B896A|nr:O-antigen ligase family protein [Niallia sp.]